MLQALRAEPRPSSTGRDRRAGQGVVGRHRDFNAISVGITEPEGITQLGITIAFCKREFNARLVEASRQRGQLSVVVELESQVVQPSALERVSSIARAGSCIAKQSQTIVFIVKKEKNACILQVDIL